MNTRDLPIVILGAGVLYVAYLLQNNQLRLVDGFQNASGSAAPPAAGPNLTDIAQKMMSVCEGPQNIDSIKQKMQAFITAPPTPVVPPTPPAPMPTAPAPMPTAPAPILNSTEGFQSFQNPYNSPSPSVAQAYEFRLGRKTLVDTTLDFMSSGK